ncbi:Pks14 protein [Mycobacteroides abscessus]|uniref:Membrane protein n=4 Tax=Mycobacteroides abscessus TaxID=36809 RepID=A0A829HVY7_9MYCO|nr:DUF3817 domain-containing protein [Mycobacteroides abscessus]ESV60658.1 integral membrane domain protein [Mycobacteroides abscessus MAB_082312_2258]ESV62670.1 integral membrane domain protein [Mycobacteroides abscessus MAB_091912_2446]AGM28081.1 hypothetical protein MASS_1479 [Mycobacteroides abscessus subsp. bolletii 50594]AIC72547.1 membrane protein [Mycobacteroides abscessus subsp. massiliense str. GO 06]AMU25309.1 hypothetical protein A3N96_07685 [Mycobacteroides abscessus]
MTENETTPDSTVVTTPLAKIRSALWRYRILAWTTGVWLIALCWEMWLKYVEQVPHPPSWIGIVHGWIYFVYLIFTTDLAVKVRWPWPRTIGTLLAGTIPLLGFIVEHYRTKQVKEQFGI